MRRLLGISTLNECIGKSYMRDGAIVIPLPHPSGASGWLNDQANRARLGKALTHVRRELHGSHRRSHERRSPPQFVARRRALPGEVRVASPVGRNMFPHEPPSYSPRWGNLPVPPPPLLIGQDGL